MSNNVAAVSGEEFESIVLKSDRPVLVDFWAEWCGPCRGLAPTIDAIAARYTGGLRVIKVNIDDAQAIIGRYAIRAVPTLILFHNGAERERIVGADAAAIAAMIDRQIAQSAETGKVVQP
jgi:thioredoxin 1